MFFLIGIFNFVLVLMCLGWKLLIIFLMLFLLCLIIVLIVLMFEL